MSSGGVTKPEAGANRSGRVTTLTRRCIFRSRSLAKASVVLRGHTASQRAGASDCARFPPMKQKWGRGRAAAR
jgi:hypothetical protein